MSADLNYIDTKVTQFRAVPVKNLQRSRRDRFGSKIALFQSVLVRSLGADIRTVLMQFPNTPTCTYPNYTGTILGILTQSKLYQHKYGLAYTGPNFNVYPRAPSRGFFGRPLYKTSISYCACLKFARFVAPTITFPSLKIVGGDGLIRQPVKS